MLENVVVIVKIVLKAMKKDNRIIKEVTEKKIVAFPTFLKGASQKCSMALANFVGIRPRTN